MSDGLEAVLAEGLRDVASRVEALARQLESRTEIGDAGKAIEDEPPEWEWRQVADLGDAETFVFPPATPGGGPWHETYEGGFRVFEGVSSEGRVRIGVGETTRNDPEVAPTFGRIRRYRVLFAMTRGSRQPVAEFCSTDDAGEGDDAARGPFVSVVRGKGPSGRQMYSPGEPPPDGYARLPIVVYRDHVRQPRAYRKAAVLAGADEIEIMLSHALAQARLRYRYRPE